MARSTLSQYILAMAFSLIAAQAHGFTLNANIKKGWKGPKLKFNLNLTSCPSHLQGAFDDAIELWNTVSTSYLEIEKGSTSSTTAPAAFIGGTASDSPVIICDPNFQATTSADQNSVVGVGISSNEGGKYLVYGGVILNTSVGTASINNMSRERTAIALAHEIGHALGFGHSADEAALMYYSITYKQELALSQDDWDALSYLYPRDELSGDLMGCGSVSTSAPPPNMSLWLLVFAAPLGLALRSRRKLLRTT